MNQKQSSRIKIVATCALAMLALFSKPASLFAAPSMKGVSFEEGKYYLYNGSGYEVKIDYKEGRFDGNKIKWEANFLYLKKNQSYFIGTKPSTSGLDITGVELKG